MLKTTASQIDEWRQLRSEHQRIEFKEAKTQYSLDRTLEYCVAIGNEGGGHPVLGVSDSPPRAVVGSAAFPDPVATEAKLFETLRFRVDVEEVAHPDGRIVVIHIPSRPRGSAFQLNGAYLMRVGESVVPMTPDRLSRILGDPAAAAIAQTDAWATNELKEKVDGPAGFEVNARYPTLLPDSGDHAEINTLLKAEALALRQEARLVLFRPPAPGLPHEHIASFEILLLTDMFVSVKVSYYRYFGGAHGVSNSTARNFRLNPVARLSLQETFVSADEGVKAMSDYCIAEIQAQKDLHSPDAIEWIKEGAGPIRKNYQCVNIVSDGLIVTFSDYQVAAYAYGPSTVFVPAYRVSRFINAASGILDLWNQPTDITGAPIAR